MGFDVRVGQAPRWLAPLAWAAMCLMVAGAPAGAARGRGAVVVDPTATRVPEPWTPIEVRGRTVACWNRAYDFGEGLLPAQIRSGGVDLLAGPMALSIKDDGRKQYAWSGIEQKWEGIRYEVKRAAPGVVEMVTQGSSDLLTVKCSYRLEFDGMLLCDVTVEPKAEPVLARRIDLVIPLSPAHARLFHHCPLKPVAQWDLNTDPLNSGAVPPAGLFLPFTHFLWVGDERRGLQWFAESDESISPLGYFVSLGEDRKLVLNLTGLRTLAKGKPFRFTFGLMASPVKPMRPTDEIRWAWQVIGDETLKPEAPDPTPRLEGTSGTGINCSFAVNIAAVVPHAKKDAVYRANWLRLMEAAEKTGINLHTCISWCSDDAKGPATPEGIDDQWLLEPRITCAFPEYNLHLTCDGGGFREWFLRSAEYAFAQLRMGGVYLDGPSIPQVCANRAHGCGYVDARGIHPTYPILAARDLMKRLYILSRATGRRSWLISHMSGSMLLPTLSFADAVLGGEHIAGWYPDQNLRYTLAGFRAEMVGRQYGLPAFWLYKNQERPTLYNALCLLHDMVPQYDGTATAFVKAYREFGAHEAEWVGYWDEKKPVSADDARLKVSSYVRPGAGALTTIANLTTERVTARVAFDAQALGLNKPGVSQTVASAEATLAQDGATVTLGPGGWLLARIGQQGAQ